MWKFEFDYEQVVEIEDGLTNSAAWVPERVRNEVHYMAGLAVLYVALGWASQATVKAVEAEQRQLVVRPAERGNEVACLHASPILNGAQRRPAYSTSCLLPNPRHSS